MVGISVLAHKFRGKTKRRSSARNHKLCLGVHTCFASGNETFLTLGGAPAVFWGGGTGPEMHSSDIGPVTFFWESILAWGAHFSLGGTRSDLGVRLRNAPVAPSLFCDNLFRINQNYCGFFELFNLFDSM